MTIARRLILDDLESTLSGIDGTGNYTSVVDHVHRHLRTFSEVDTTSRPVICIVPGATEYEQEPSRCMKAVFTVDLLCYVTGATEDERINRLNDLLDDLFIALYADPTRGGNAYETRIISDITDEADALAEYGQQSLRVTLNIWYTRTTGVST